jgi:hypothetical protein
MDLEIIFHGRVNCWKKMLFAESREKPKALQLVFDRIFQFGKVQFDTRRLECAVKFGQNVGRGNVCPIQATLLRIFNPRGAAEPRLRALSGWR